MRLRMFSDQCVPAEITDTLRRHGHQVALLREVLPIRSPDPVVVAQAQEYAEETMPCAFQYDVIISHSSKDKVVMACSYAGVLRLVGTTQPRTGVKMRNAAADLKALSVISGSRV